jgi:hypothetical protein
VVGRKRAEAYCRYAGLKDGECKNKGYFAHVRMMKVGSLNDGVPMLDNPTFNLTYGVKKFNILVHVRKRGCEGFVWTRTRAAMKAEAVAITKTYRVVEATA